MKNNFSMNCLFIFKNHDISRTDFVFGLKKCIVSIKFSIRFMANSGSVGKQKTFDLTLVLGNYELLKKSVRFFIN